VTAIVAFFAGVFVVGGEAEEGLYLLISSGLFLIVIGPPVLNAVLVVRLATLG
jgi:hypothetical protein